RTGTGVQTCALPIGARVGELSPFLEVSLVDIANSDDPHLLYLDERAHPGAAAASGSEARDLERVIGCKATRRLDPGRGRQKCPCAVVAHRLEEFSPRAHGSCSPGAFSNPPGARSTSDSPVGCAALTHPTTTSMAAQGAGRA